VNSAPFPPLFQGFEHEGPDVHGIDFFQSFAVQDFAGAAEGGDPSFAHNGGAAREMPYQVKIVERRDGNFALLSGPAGKVLQDLRLVLEIQVVCGFVQEYEIGILRQGSGEKHTLKLSARKLGDHPVPDGGKLKLRDDPVYDFAVFF
jgi:hypothetical protein